MLMNNTNVETKVIGGVWMLDEFLSKLSLDATEWFKNHSLFTIVEQGDAGIVVFAVKNCKPVMTDYIRLHMRFKETCTMGRTYVNDEGQKLEIIWA